MAQVDFLSKTVWVLDDGKVGHTNQSLGLAKAIGAEPIIIPCQPQKRRSLLDVFAPEIGAQNLPKPPWPDMCIATGWHLGKINQYIKKQSPYTFTVQCLPRGGAHKYDVAVSMFHDQLKPAENQVVLLGAPTRITNELLSKEATKWQPHFGQYPKPWAAVLIGGSNKKIDFDETKANALAEDLIYFANLHGYSLLVTVSRRTGMHQRVLLQDRLSRSGIPVHFWDGEGDNPYFGMLGLCEAVVVTADSFSMVSEAVAAGKPVYIHGLQDWNIGKFRHCYNELIAQNRIAEISDTLLPKPDSIINETDKAASFIVERYVARARAKAA